MARVKVEITKGELEEVIQTLEAENGPYKNRSALHDAVAETDWAKYQDPKPITAAVVGLRIAEFGIEPLTPKGKKGRPAGFNPQINQAKRRQTKKAILSNPRVDIIFDRLAKDAPVSLQRTVERARRGSLAAAVKVQCCHCVGFEQAAENIRGCSATMCALYPFRPYQSITVNGEDADDDSDD
jgi:hypothetical protein